MEAWTGMGVCIDRHFTVPNHGVQGNIGTLNRISESLNKHTETILVNLFKNCGSLLITLQCTLRIRF